MSDVARAIGVSHAALYRHYDSKAALRKAVVERWIHAAIPLLQEVVESGESVEKRLYHWLDTLRMFKRERARKDPELFTMYAALVAEIEGVLEHHIELLLKQLVSIIEDGMSSGTFAKGDARQAAEAVLLSTSRFHHAAHASEWEWPDADSRFDAVWELIRCGLAART
ncbi:division inhibitor protein [compost metagenome]